MHISLSCSSHKHSLNFPLQFQMQLAYIHSLYVFSFACGCTNRHKLNEHSAVTPEKLPWPPYEINLRPLIASSYM